MADREYNNIPSNKEMYKMLCDLTNKYKLLENKSYEKEKLTEKNRNNILLLNKNFIIMKNYFDENIKKLEFKINELELKITEITKKNNYIYYEEIKNLKLKLDNIEKSTNKIFESIKLNNDKNQKALLEQNKDIKINLENFENLLLTILSKEEGDAGIDKENLEQFKNLTSILIKQNVSPLTILSNFFHEKYRVGKDNNSNNIDMKRLERISKIQLLLINTVNNIEYQIKYKSNFGKDTKNNHPPKKDIVADFRKEFGITEKDSSDDEIKNLLKLNDKYTTYNYIIAKILKKK